MRPAGDFFSSDLWKVCVPESNRRAYPLAWYFLQINVPLPHLTPPVFYSAPFVRQVEAMRRLHGGEQRKETYDSKGKEKMDKV